MPGLSTGLLMSPLDSSGQTGGLAEGVAVEEVDLVYVPITPASDNGAKDDVARQDVYVAGVSQYLSAQPSVGGAVDRLNETEAFLEIIEAHHGLDVLVAQAGRFSSGWVWQKRS